MFEVRVDVLAPDPYPAELPVLEPLRLALTGLSDWFLELLTVLRGSRNGQTLD